MPELLVKLCKGLSANVHSMNYLVFCFLEGFVSSVVAKTHSNIAVDLGKN